jgi:mannose-6-phosphate isomerase-like protein (cupin superfamily)
MQHFDLSRLMTERERAGKPWLEFLRVPSLSVGVYHLKAGQEDPQRPHTEDEVYYIVAGRAQFRSGGEERDVGPGTVLFVERLAEHRFVAIAEDLTALVFFAPAESSLQGVATARS